AETSRAFNTKNFQQVQIKWVDVATNYERRADLVNGIYHTAKANESIDKGLLEELRTAGEEAKKHRLEPNDLSAETVASFQKMQQRLTVVIRKTTEAILANKELSSNQNYLSLQMQMENIENRINVSKQAYNAAVALYNKGQAANKAPKKDISFKADAGAENAPAVKF
ncbi:MAG: hypothetical protein EOP53_24735, partial [Sphingobacteriales bacterium]